MTAFVSLFRYLRGTDGMANCALEWETRDSRDCNLQVVCRAMMYTEWVYVL
jgi:hypothetical protein